MNGLEHLARLPSYLINLDRSTDRLAHAETHVAPIFRSMTRVPALDGSLLGFEHAKVFHDGSREIILDDRKQPHELQIAGRNGGQGCKDDSTLKRYEHTYAATYACYLSHMHAIQCGIDSEQERFVIVEDDALPRYDVLERVSTPDSCGAYIWGGAIQMGAYRSDEAKYVARRWMNKPMDWIGISSPQRLYIAAAYELDRESAITWHSVLSRYVMAYDVSWWYGMKAVPSYRLSPCGFTQAEFISTRKHKDPRII